MNFILLLAVFAIAVTSVNSALLGTKECTYGPSYWCHSFKNAKQCNAFTHCLQTTWEKQHFQKDNDEVCKLCEQMVNDARDVIASKDAEAKVKEIVDRSCQQVPLPAVAKECKALADEYLPELFDALRSAMEPNVVCSVAGLCNSDVIDKLLIEQNEIVPSKLSDPMPGDCRDCTKFVSDTIRTVKEHSLTELSDHLMSLCGRLSSLSDACMALVAENLDAIYQFITTEIKPNELCDLFGMCERIYGRNEVLKQDLMKGVSKPCAYCQAVSRNWQKSLVKDVGKEEFKMMLDVLCHQTGHFESECLALSSRFSDETYDALTSPDAPHEVCDAIGLCGRNRLFQEGNKLPIWPLLRVGIVMQKSGVPFTPLTKPYNIKKDEVPKLIRVPLIRQDASIRVVSSGLIGRLPVPKQSQECVMCEFTLHFIQNILQDKTTREEVERAVEGVCNLLPHTVMEECQDYIEAYGDQVISLIVENIDPSIICPLLGLCPSKTTLERIDVTIENKGQGCVMCEFVMTQLDEILKQKATEEEIRNAVENVCTLMPSSVEAQCRAFVDTYVKDIIDLIVNGMTPKEVCKQLGLCPDKVNSLPPLDAFNAQLPIERMMIPLPEKPRAKKQSVTCAICEFAMKELDEYLVNNRTQEMVEHAVRDVCLFLPRTLMHDCLAFVEEYGVAIIQLIVSELSPQVICTEIRLCHPSSFIEGFMSDQMVVFDKPKPKGKCEVCHFVADAVDWFRNHQDKIVDNEVNAVEERVCGTFKAKEDQQTCFKMCEDYVNLWSVLSNLDGVCKAFMLCP